MLLEQLEDVLVGLRGQRQGRGRELLTGLQSEQIGASSLLSASVRLSAPVLSVLIIALVKSWRTCTVCRFELSACDWDRRVTSAAVSSVPAVVISPAVAQALAEAAIARSPAQVLLTPAIVTVEDALSFRVMVRLLPPSRLVPLMPESLDSWTIWVRIESNWLAKVARTLVSEVCCAWLTSDWADCTSLVMEVMPLLAA